MMGLFNHNFLMKIITKIKNVAFCCQTWNQDKKYIGMSKNMYSIGITVLEIAITFYELSQKCCKMLILMMPIKIAMFCRQSIMRY